MNKKYTNILLWVNKKIKNDILPTKCHFTICMKFLKFIKKYYLRNY